MAGREFHIGYLAHIPRIHDESSGIGVGLYIVNELSNLVDHNSVGALPRAPLCPIDWPNSEFLLEKGHNFLNIFDIFGPLAQPEIGIPKLWKGLGAELSSRDQVGC